MADKLAQWNEQMGGFIGATEQYGVDQFGQAVRLPPAVTPSNNPSGFRQFDAQVPTPDSEELVGHKRILEAIDNQLGPVAGILTANVAGVESPIFAWQVPPGMKVHFMPEGVNKVDRGATAIHMELYTVATPSILMVGQWFIKSRTVNNRQDLKMIASGSLREFGRGTTLSSDPTNLEQRVTADREVWATTGQWVQVSLACPVDVLNPATSDIFIKCMEGNM